MRGDFADLGLVDIHVGQHVRAVVAVLEDLAAADGAGVGCAQQPDEPVAVIEVLHDGLIQQGVGGGGDPAQVLLRGADKIQRRVGIGGRGERARVDLLEVSAALPSGSVEEGVQPEADGIGVHAQRVGAAVDAIKCGLDFPEGAGEDPEIGLIGHAVDAVKVFGGLAAGGGGRGGHDGIAGEPVEPGRLADAG